MNLTGYSVFARWKWNRKGRLTGKSDKCKRNREDFERADIRELHFRQPQGPSTWRNNIWICVEKTEPLGFQYFQESQRTRFGQLHRIFDPPRELRVGDLSLGALICLYVRPHVVCAFGLLALLLPVRVQRCSFHVCSFRLNLLPHSPQYFSRLFAPSDFCQRTKREEKRKGRGNPQGKQNSSTRDSMHSNFSLATEQLSSLQRWVSNILFQIFSKLFSSLKTRFSTKNDREWR